jgi:benzoyl-CoA 2,3-dioxygenase component B
LKRIVRAGLVPVSVIQKYVNKWLPASLDLFGMDQSDSAQWLYIWGFKGRCDEGQTQQAADLGHMNEHSRARFYLHCKEVIEQINKYIPADRPGLYVPDIKFNRRIGEFAGQPYNTRGELLAPERYKEHMRESLPQEADVGLILQIQQDEPKWLAPKGAMES